MILISNSLKSHRRSPFGFVFRLIVAGLLFMCSFARAQEQDSLVFNTGDTLSVIPDTLVRNHSPRKALMYSLICPGLGQVYNKKYWKIPFIYGAGGAFLYFINYNQTKYKKFRDARFDEKDTQRTVVIDGYAYQYDNLEIAQDYFRRYRDLSIAGLAAIYLISAIDAMVDAHFFYYDISENLSMRIQPAVENPGYFATLGFKINFGF